LSEGKISQEDVNHYLARYDAWKKGLDMPVDGSPIKGWGMISPSQQKLLISVGILTVEDLAQVNDEGIRRIGMGAVELRRKANAWIAQLDDKGQLTQQMTAMQTENDVLKGQVATLSEQVNKLMAMVPNAKPTGQKER
jgi:polyhydroxyalkanoate synthesis regulator phasin